MLSETNSESITPLPEVPIEARIEPSTVRSTFRVTTSGTAAIGLPSASVPPGSSVMRRSVTDFHEPAMLLMRVPASPPIHSPSRTSVASPPAAAVRTQGAAIRT